MPQTRSSAKRLRQDLKRRARNRATRSQVKTGMLAVLAGVRRGEKEAAVAALKRFFSIVDRAGRRGVLKQNHISRQKSRLSRKVNALKSA